MVKRMPPKLPVRTLSARVLDGTAWLFSGRVLQACLRIIVLSVLARHLRPEEFGIAAAGMLIIQFFRVFLRTGVAPAVIQRSEMTEKHVRVAATFSVAMGTTCGCILHFYATEMSALVFDSADLAPILRMLSLLLPIQSLSIVAQALMERRLAFDRVARVELIAYLAYGGVGVSLAVTGHGPWALVYGFLVESLVRSMLALFFERHSWRPLLDVALAKEVFFFSAGFSLARLGNFLGGHGDNWVVARWLGDHALGFYKYAFEMSTMISNLIGGVLDRVLFPAMATIQKDETRIGSTYLTGVALVSMIMLPVSATAVVAAPELIRVVLGPGWDAVVIPFRVLSIALSLRASYKVADAVARATGAVYQRVWRQALYGLSVIGFSWLGHHWGIGGVAVGAVGGVVVNAVAMNGLTMRITRVSWGDVMIAHLGALRVFLLSATVSYMAAIYPRSRDVIPVVTLSAIFLAQALIVVPLVLRYPDRFLGRMGSEAAAVLGGRAAKAYPRAERFARSWRRA